MDKAWYHMLRSKSSTVGDDQKLATPDESVSGSSNCPTPSPSSSSVESTTHSQSPKQEPNRPKFLPTFWPLGRGGNASPLLNTSTSATEGGKFEVGGRHRALSGSFPETKKFNPVEALWSDPSLIQTGDSLLTVMMSSHDSMKPIPVQYNSYVLQLLEAFRHHHGELQRQRAEQQLLTARLQKDIEENRKLQEEWIQCEESYLAEIRRLELILANESDKGVGAVIMARSGTLVDRSGKKRFKSRIDNQLSLGGDGDGLTGPAMVPPGQTSTRATDSGSHSWFLEQRNGSVASEAMRGSDPVDNDQTDGHRRLLVPQATDGVGPEYSQQLLSSPTKRQQDVISSNRNNRWEKITASLSRKRAEPAGTPLEFNSPSPDSMPLKTLSAIPPSQPKQRNFSFSTGDDNYGLKPSAELITLAVQARESAKRGHTDGSDPLHHPGPIAGLGEDGSSSDDSSSDSSECSFSTIVKAGSRKGSVSSQGNQA